MHQKWEYLCYVNIFLTGDTSHLSGSMSSAIILNAASANFFWSTLSTVADGVAPELEPGLELELGGKEELGEKNSLFDDEVCGGGATFFFFTF